MNDKILNGKHEVTLPKWQFAISCGLMIVLSAAALIGSLLIFMVANGHVVAFADEKEPATVEATPVQQGDATAMAEEAEKVLADRGIVAGKGNIERIYATAPNKLTIVTSYTENTPEEKVRAVAAAAWGAGLSNVEGLETVEVMDADDLDSPLFSLDEDQL